MRRRIWGCSHDATITTITAGLAREVCELCAHVSVRYVESAVRLIPEIEAVASDTAIFEARITFERVEGCRTCAQPARYLTPAGLSCEEHAWQAAARLDWEATDPWVPIPIDISSV